MQAWGDYLDLGYSMKRFFATALVFAGISQAQYLDHDYNMGRIVGGPYAFTSLIAEIDKDFFSVVPMQRYRFGVADRYQWDLDLAGYFQSVPDQIHYGLGLLDLGGIYRIEDGQVMDWHLRNRNLGFSGSKNSIVSGFDQQYEKTLDLYVDHRYLSNNGYIHLDSSDFNIAFLRGPLLNGGQYRHTMSASMHYGNGSEEWFAADYAPSVGIADLLELKAAGGAAFIDPTGTERWNNSLQVGAEFRLSRLWVAGSAWQSNMGTLEEANTVSDYTASSDVGLVLGPSRSLQFTQVEGNYDGFFTPQLGMGQILLRNRSNSQPGDNGRILDFTSELSAGALDELTLGATHHMDRHAASPDHSLSLHAVYSNIPLRTDGPYDVTDMEYLWGYLFQPGDWRISCNWITPLLSPREEVGVIYSPIYRYTNYDAPRFGSFSQQLYAQSNAATMRFQALVGLAEEWYGKLEYGYFTNGLTVSGDAEPPHWPGRAHAATIAAGHTHFNSIWEAGLQIQTGSREPSGNIRNVYPIYFKSAARF